MRIYIPRMGTATCVCKPKELTTSGDDNSKGINLRGEEANSVCLVLVPSWKGFKPVHTLFAQVDAPNMRFASSYRWVPDNSKSERNHTPGLRNANLPA